MEEALSVTLRVIATLDDLGIPYVVGGSIASAIVGERARRHRDGAAKAAAGTAVSPVSR